ncbi:hypothetical protein Tco_0957153 [Tanacetum coccineum]
MIPLNNLGPDLACKPVNETSYRGMIGSLMCLTTTTPDIQFSTVLCTPTLGLYYLKCSGFNLKGYSDSEYAGCNIDRKSTSAEAEYVIADGCYSSILWIKSQLSDYDIYYKMVHIFCDNTSAIAISNNPVLYSRTKHIDISGVPKPPKGVLVHCHCLSHLNPPTDDSEGLEASRSLPHKRKKPKFKKTPSKTKEIDNEEVFAAGEEIDEDIPPTNEEA